jgi:hypothetical protein
MTPFLDRQAVWSLVIVDIVHAIFVFYVPCNSLTQQKFGC